MADYFMPLWDTIKHGVVCGSAQEKPPFFHRRDGRAAEQDSEFGECVKMAGSAAFEVAPGSFLEIVKANVA